MLRVESEPSKIVSLQSVNGTDCTTNGTTTLVVSTWRAMYFIDLTYININHSNVSTSRNIVLRKKS